MTNSKYEYISEIKQIFQQGDVKEITKILRDIEKKNLIILSKDDIPELFDYFNYSVIKQKKLLTVERLLFVLGFLDYNDSKFYKKIIKKLIEKGDQIENIINFLIEEYNLGILTIEELNSLPIMKLSLNPSDADIPKEIGYIISLEELQIDSEEDFGPIPDSIQNLINLKILDLGYANYLKTLPKTIVNLRNLKTLILPKWNNAFELPECITQMNWVENIEFQLYINDKSILFNLKDFFVIFNDAEIIFIYENLISLERQQYKDYKFSLDLMEFYVTKRNSTKNLDIKQKIEKLIFYLIKLNYKIIRNHGYAKYDIIKRTATLIGKKYSSFFKKWIKDSLKKEDTSKLSDYVVYKWLFLLTKVDFIDLLKDPQLNFYRQLLETQYEYYGFGKEVDDIIFEHIIGKLPTSEAQTLKDLKGKMKNSFLPVYERYFEGGVNAFEIRGQHIKGLFIHDSGLDHLPDSIGNLIYLERLNIEHTNLTHLPDTIGQLLNLKSIRISSCKLYMLPDTIGNILSLKILDLYDNQLKELPKSIVNLRSLTYLDISDNKFKVLPIFLADLVSLEEMHIIGNKIKNIHPSVRSYIDNDEIEEIVEERLKKARSKYSIRTDNQNNGIKIYSENYDLNRYYDLLIKIIDKTGDSEEKIQKEITKYIEENKGSVGVLNGIKKIGQDLGLEIVSEINEEAVIQSRKEMPNISDFESMNKLEDFINSKVPYKIKAKLVKEGELFQSKGEFKKAEELYKKALEIDSHDNHLIYDYCTVLIKVEKYDQGLFWNDKLVDEYPISEWDILTQKAYLFVKTKRSNDEILEILRELFEKWPSHIQIIIQDPRFNRIVALKTFKEMIKPTRIFTVNENIELKLEIGGIALYVGGKMSNWCSHLALINPYDKDYFNNIEERPEGYKGLTKEEEFWGLCSCLQGWAENMYNSELLHESLALSLLEELKKIGDPIAQQVYNKEIARIVKYGDFHTQEYLRREEYISKLSEEELLHGSLNSPDSEIMVELSKKTSRNYSVVGNFGTDDYRKGHLTKNYYYSLENGHVVELEIKLSSTYPEILANLRKLEHLNSLIIYIINTRQVKPIFNKIHSITKLEILTAGKVVLPDTFDAFPNLKTLRIRTAYDASVSFEKVPESICALQQLTWLDIYGVRLPELPSDIGNLENLEWLIIDNTGLESIPESIYELENLDIIRIENNPFRVPLEVKQMKYRFINEVYEKIKERDGVDLNILKSLVNLSDYKFDIAINNLEIRRKIYKEGTKFKVVKKN
ncbi:hypothetical protein LCGC14_0715460 [marine sediment metagenome]|uniref:Disease resistance R13L4/SHOC-2-like LRR domain-containing protein n=1 Tax=marine sediment metagenome TaxID=412755 RepID=A0A0F9SZB8_9ZZZZ